ncbi:MAG: hypothetical protein MPW14_17750 [Candidatus Manganitrophus sp.]|nr:MAG: hypothetical protein MPW14_17750 [Candidatus Manganitrophus sp.]
MEIFIARQPIFDRQQQVYAYELLFRSSLENIFNHPDVEHASSKVALDTFFTFGIDTITGGKKAFINTSRGMLVNGYIALLPGKWRWLRSWKRSSPIGRSSPPAEN